MKCEGCGIEFKPTKPWQRFHSTKCQQAWNYQQRKADAIEAAGEQRVNGHDLGTAEQRAQASEAFAVMVQNLTKPRELIKRRI